MLRETWAVVEVESVAAPVDGGEGVAPASGSGRRGWRWLLVVFAVLLAVAEFVVCGWTLMVFLSGAPNESWRWLAGYDEGPYGIVTALLVCLPFALSGMMALALVIEQVSGADYQLRVGLAPSQQYPAQTLCERDDAMWQQTRRAVLDTWNYELSRFLRRQHAAPVNALAFGLVASISLTVSVVLGSLQIEPFLFLPRLMTSMGAAAATAFLANLARLLWRLTGNDPTARMFAWATRSLILVIVADVGLFAVLHGQGVLQATDGALLLGVFTGALGDRAILLLMEKAPASLGLTQPAVAEASQLSDLEGITFEHVERLKEEGVLSTHDLAFIPTARLFFNTAYSLQQICNWQDRALLSVYVGKKGAEALADKMQIRGAIDLGWAAHDVMQARRAAATGQTANEGKTQGEALSKEGQTLQATLNMDDGAFDAFVTSMEHDAATRQIGLLWGSAVTTTETVV